MALPIPNEVRKAQAIAQCIIDTHKAAAAATTPFMAPMILASGLARVSAIRGESGRFHAWPRTALWVRLLAMSTGERVLHKYWEDWATVGDIVSGALVELKLIDSVSQQTTDYPDLCDLVERTTYTMAAEVALPSQKHFSPSEVREIFKLMSASLRLTNPRS